jgi:guanosine-3',5'-bis(diphosphate) 3'-pyrophosphohydrolase
MSTLHHALSLIFDALAFAAERHRDQRRKNAEASPYINHPIALAHILVNEGHIADPVVICAALLHDTIEDTETLPEEIERRFGPQIHQVVMEVSDDKNLPRSERKRLQIEHSSGLSDAAKLVKLADKICNVRDIADAPPVGWSLARKQEYFDWAKSVVDGLRGVSPRLEEVFDRAYERRPR